MSRVRCPSCGSEQFTTHQKGYSGAGGLFGYHLFGPGGLLLGTVQSKEIRATCLECGKQWRPGRNAKTSGGCCGCLALIAFVLFGIPLLFGLISGVGGRPPEARRQADVPAPPGQAPTEPGQKETAPPIEPVEALGRADLPPETEPFPVIEPEPEPEPEWRTWTDATGEFRTEAVFKGMSFGQVRLLRRDGQEITVPLDRLSPDDQEWIRRRRY